MIRPPTCSDQQERPLAGRASDSMPPNRWSQPTPTRTRYKVIVSRQAKCRVQNVECGVWRLGVPANGKLHTPRFTLLRKGADYRQSCRNDARAIFRFLSSAILAVFCPFSKIVFKNVFSNFNFERMLQRNKYFCSLWHGGCERILGVQA